MQRNFEPSSHSNQDVDVELELLDLTCPSCGSDLIADELFLSHRMCGTCNRHFSIGARERISLLMDSGLFEELNVTFAAPEDTLARDQFPTAERLAEHQHLQVIGEAIITGLGRIGGVNSVAVVLDDHLVGASLGALMTEKIILALEYARTRKHPVVLLCAGGTSSSQAGPLSLVQGGRLAAALAHVRLDRVPVVGVLTHPLAGSVFGTLAAHCDVLFSEPGVHVASGTSNGGGAPLPQQWQSVDDLLNAGWIDGIVDRSRLKSHVGALIDLISNPGMARTTATVNRTEDGSHGSGDVAAYLDHPQRPRADEYITGLFPGFMELHGDRVAGDDPAVVCGFGRFESLSAAIAAQRYVADYGVESQALAARKIARLARLAGRFELPLVLLVDGGPAKASGDFSPEAAFAISSLASMLSLLPVPVISIGVGRASGALSTALMVGDRQFLMSSAVYAPPLEGSHPHGTFPPQPRAPRPQGRAGGGVSVLLARECERLGLVDGVIEEPKPGAHADPDGTMAAVRSTLLQALAELTGTGQRRLLDTRQRRQRSLGQSTPEGLAAARSELWELQELQRSLGRSIDEWRVRWDQLKASQPRVSFQRPDITDLATRLRARRAELLERAGLGDRSQG